MKNIRVIIFGNNKLVIRSTKKYGKGIFAINDINKGELVYRLSGEKVSLAECWRRINLGEEDLADPFQIGLRTYIDLDEVSRVFNHSCDPNTGVRNKSDLIAVRDIKKGEEITYDYSTTVGPNIPNTEWSMLCSCNSDNCRKTISNILSLPIKQYNYYKKNMFLPDYIKKMNLIRNKC